MNKRYLNLKYFFLDFLSCLLAWALFYIFRKNILEGQVFGEYNIFKLDFNFYIGSVLIPLTWVFVFFILGSYKDVYKKSRLRELTTSLVVGFLGVVVIFFALILDDFVATTNTLRTSFLVLLSLQYGLNISFRMFFLGDIKSKLKSRKIGFNTIIAGDDVKVLEIYEELENKKYSQGYLFNGYFTTSGNTLNGRLSKVPFLGSTSKLLESLKNSKTEDVILAFQNKDKEFINTLIQELSLANLKIKIVPDAYDMLVGNVKMNYIFGTALIDVNPEIMPDWQKNLKRIIDIFLSLLFILLFSPFFIVLAILVKFSSKGPILYSQERIGLDKVPFQIYKFRSMFIDAEKLGPQLSSENDSRVTPIGRNLRKYRLDELPQFFNVLAGGMSLVGPRPERQFFIDQIVKQAPEYKLLHKVKPGITSWGQIKYGYAENVSEMIERMKFDLLYIENMSLAMDIKILFYTLVIMIQGRGK